jgi:hypothetical protein
MKETKTAQVELTKKVYPKLRKKMSGCKSDCKCSKCS